MKMIKEYSVFTSPWYKILMWGVIPAAQLATTLILYHFLKDVTLPVLSGRGMGIVFIALLMPIMIMLLTEVISDIFFMKAVDRKKIQGMGYLLSSAKGKNFFGSAIIVDAIRKALVIVAFTVIPYCLYLRSTEFDAFLYFSAALSVFGGVMLELIVSRLSGTFVMSILISMIAVYVVGPFIMFVAVIPRWIVVLVDIAIVFIIAFYFFDIYRKLGRSYFDE